MLLKEWQYSLCTRFATQLLPPESFTDNNNDQHKQALEFGLRKIEFDTPQNIQTELGFMQVFVEKPETTIGGARCVIPQEHRYILGHIINGDMVHLFEKISQVREPAQEEEHYLRIETLRFDHAHTSAVGIAMRTDLDGAVRSMSYRHYWSGDKADLIDISSIGQELNISVDRWFDRGRRPPYTAKKTRRLQIRALPKMDKFTVEIDDQNYLTSTCSKEELEVVDFSGNFRSDDIESFFYTKPNRLSNTVSIANGIVTISGQDAYWQTNLLGATFTNETTYQQLLPMNGPDILAQEIQKSIRQFMTNQHHVNLENNQVVLV